MSKEFLNQPNFNLVAFDVDGTICASKRNSDKIVDLLNQLMQKKRVALISGSSYQALETKMVSKLASTGHEFDVYASGGSVHLTYKNGERIYNPLHATDVLFPSNQVEEVRRVVELSVRTPNLWDIGFLEMFSKWAQATGEGMVPREIRGWQIKITSPGEVDPNSPIRVEARQDPLESRIVGLSIKSIPRELNGKKTFFIDRLSQRLKNNFKGEFQILPAGFASIDINMGNGNKKRAIDHLESRGFSRDKILYFGDEFGVNGNDRDVLKAGVENYFDVSLAKNGLTGPDLTEILIEGILSDL